MIRLGFHITWNQKPTAWVEAGHENENQRGVPFSPRRGHINRNGTNGKPERKTQCEHYHTFRPQQLLATSFLHGKRPHDHAKTWVPVGVLPRGRQVPRGHLAAVVLPQVHAGAGAGAARDGPGPVDLDAHGYRVGPAPVGHQLALAPGELIPDEGPCEVGPERLAFYGAATGELRLPCRYRALAKWREYGTGMYSR